MRNSLALLISIPIAFGGCQSHATSTAEPPTAIAVNLGTGGLDVDLLIEHFESRNAGHNLDWFPATTGFSADQATVAFVQSGTGSASLAGAKSEFSVGDIFCLNAGDRCELDAPAGLLVFTLSQEHGVELPPFIRPDWDDKITDTPGGCATEGDAYRRILLTWLGKNGPYLSQQINAHRVRIHDSFTHYHPPVGGFDEFYLVQEAPPGARLLVSEKLDSMLSPNKLSDADAADLLREIPLHVGDLVYLPRGVVHRGVGGAVVQVITVPGFVPGAEIPVDNELQTINRLLGLNGDHALPFHKGNDFVNVSAVPSEAGSALGGDTKISIGGKPFTTLRYDRRLPDLWPIRNAAGHPVTRVWPRDGSEGEQEDHPHHQSFWFAHGDLSGLDFWHDPKLKVRPTSVERGSGKGRGFVESKHDWLKGNGELVCTDARRIEFFAEGSARGIDFDITIQAGNEGLRFGDTKEGTFALRIASGLVADLGGELLNDSGKKGKATWGQPARWIQARGEIAGTETAIVIAGHSENLRHPSRWQARNYGLLAANPFGLQAFAGKPKGTGDLQVAAGESARFRYRVLVFSGHPTTEEVERLLEGFTSASKL